MRDLLAEVMESVPEKVTGVVIPGCGHFVPEERPEPIADLVLGLTDAACGPRRRPVLITTTDVPARPSVEREIA